MSQRICKKCGKSEASTRAGSLTSFFFQHNFCQCKAAQPQDNRHKDYASSVCKNCGKSRPENKRVGSFTSFLFQELRCTCPSALPPTQSRNETHTATSARVALRRQFTNSRFNSLENGSSQTVFQPGDLISGFRIKNQIGLGGMGIVYLVDHTALNRQFALKVLAPDLVNEQNWLRFQGEAKTMASLNHRTFVKVYDLGIHAKAVPFYSMDYLNGRTLETILVEDGPIDLGQSLDIFIEVLDGLAYAHRNGIIHRDLKPANIMVCTSGGANQIKILDFGISKFVGSDASKIQSLTAAGDIFGSPFYMSPEQCNGETVDARSDLYSIGCSLFEVLSGFVPYEGSNSVETVMMHQEHTPPRLSDMRPELKLSPSVDLVIAKCLAKEPAERYQSAKELSADLIRIREGRDVQTYNSSYSETTSKSPRQKKVAIISAAVIAPLIVAAVAALMTTSLTANKESSAPKQAISSVGNLNSSEPLDLPKREEAKKQETNNKLMKMLEKQAFSSENTSNTIADIELIEKITDKGATLPQTKRTSIENFIRQRNEPYSTIKTLGGKKLCLFNLPTNFSLGTLGFRAPGSSNWIKANASGTLIANCDPKLSLNAAQELLSFPELLQYFRPNELNTVNLNDSTLKPAAFLKALAKQTELHGLELKGTSLNDADLVLIDNFQELKSLDISNTRVTGSALAKCKLLPSLTVLHAGMLANATPALTALAKNNNLKELNLNSTKLSAADYALISQMTNLQILSLKESAIKDADLLRLSSLPNLNTLYIDRCGNLTATTIDTLKRFKSLKELRPPDQLEELFSDETLHQFFPHLRVI